MYYELLSQDEERHARLKNVLEKLVVGNCPTRLDFKHPVVGFGISIGIETLVDLAVATIKHRDVDLAFAALPFLDPKSDLFQFWPKPRHNYVAVLDQRFSRVNGIGEIFEYLHDGNAERGQR